MRRALPAVLTFACLASVASAAEPVQYTGKSHPDPFLDPSTVPSKAEPNKKMEAEIGKKLSQLKVQGVIVSRDNNLAIINGKVVKPNSMLEGLRVKKIEPDGVLLEHPQGGKQFKLAYKKGTSK